MQSGSNPDAGADSLRAMVAWGAVLEVRAKYDHAMQVLEAALKLQPQGSDATGATAI